MTQLSELEFEVSKLQPAKGDVVVLRLSNATHLTSDAVQTLAEQLKASLPNGAHGVVLFGSVGEIEGFTTLLDRAEAAIVETHDGELRAYLSGEVAANAWRPRVYAEAAIRAAFDVAPTSKEQT